MQQRGEDLSLSPLAPGCRLSSRADYRVHPQVSGVQLQPQVQGAQVQGVHEQLLH